MGDKDPYMNHGAYPVQFVLHVLTVSLPSLLIID